MAEVRYDVLGIGSAIVDIIARTDDDFLRRFGMVKGTMALTDAAQAKAIYDEMGRAVEISGGSVANTMAGIASLGGTPCFIGKVGNDKLGEIFAHEIKVVGVDFHGGENRPTKLPTATCLILVTADGQRTMIVVDVEDFMDMMYTLEQTKAIIQEDPDVTLGEYEDEEGNVWQEFIVKDENEEYS